VSVPSTRCEVEIRRQSWRAAPPRSNPHRRSKTRGTRLALAHRASDAAAPAAARRVPARALLSTRRRLSSRRWCTTARRLTRDEIERRSPQQPGTSLFPRKGIYGQKPCASSRVSPQPTRSTRPPTSTCRRRTTRSGNFDKRQRKRAPPSCRSAQSRRHGQISRLGQQARSQTGDAQTSLRHAARKKIRTIRGALQPGPPVRAPARCRPRSTTTTSSCSTRVPNRPAVRRRRPRPSCGPGRARSNRSHGRDFSAAHRKTAGSAFGGVRARRLPRQRSRRLRAPAADPEALSGRDSPRASNG